jgi:phage terminase large subunit-like protein
MLMFGLRLKQRPRCLVATTPRPTKLIRELLAREGHDVAVTRGSTYENRANLAPGFFDQVIRKYEGTRLGRQELNAELLEDTPGALWTLARIDRSRSERVPDLARIVVAVDPAVSSNEGSDETGIIVCGKDDKGHGYVLEDLSGRYDPAGWARAAIAAYHRRDADRVVAEVNQGGDLVEATIRTVDPNVAYTAVRASRGKFTRAEPVAALYEQGRVHHCGLFPELEDQLTSFVPDLERAKFGSPDRVDALVWAFTELLVEAVPYAGLLQYYAAQLAAKRPEAAEETLNG